MMVNSNGWPTELWCQRPVTIVTIDTIQMKDATVKDTPNLENSDMVGEDVMTIWAQGMAPPMVGITVGVVLGISTGTSTQSVTVLVMRMRYPATMQRLTIMMNS